MKNYDYVAVEQKWQKKWFDANIFEAKKQGRKNFFIHFAYPGVSGYLHVGHMRGFTYCDVIARYKMMNGFDVLFPAGFHASGIPSIGFAKKIERGDKETIEMLKGNGCSDELIEKLKDPIEVVKYFSKVYAEDYWKRFGFLIDYTRMMSTISDGYKHFIDWQFRKLNRQGLLIKKPHFAPFCPNCGPVAVDKSETDVSQGGNAEILEFTAIKFKIEGDKFILPAATLRPETVFGVTNMWINPNVEYVKVHVDDETWICSKECASKIVCQLDNVKMLDGVVSGKDMIGKKCIVPMVNRVVPILAGTFVDPNVATGVVMSVPAHAPYDWIALIESKREDILPITIINVKGFGTNPAREVSEQFGIKSTAETEKLDEATELLYKKEFHTGVLNEQCGVYAKIQISNIKDAVKDEMVQQNIAVIMREFSEHVICRCGETVTIKKIPDQWFIKYSDNALTKESKDHAQTMNIYPEEYKDELPKVLDWFDDRACIRKGSWLGTEFPFKKGWIIEPISDSTLYPAYYIISKYVNNGALKPEEMNEEFFDYIFLGKGKAKNETWNEIRSDFEFWYPVDINLGGKEHKTVHFPVFLMNHVAVMPKEKWPQGIFAHWWVTQKGKEKISKSKGGAEPIPEAASLYGVDAMRLYYTHIGSPFVDVEWDVEIVNRYKNRILGIWRLVTKLLNMTGTGNDNIDKWLQSAFNRKIRKICNAFDRYDLRVAANEVFFELPKDIQWYLKRGGSNKELLRGVISDWIRLVCPITPHLAEELRESIHGKGFVSQDCYPKHDPSLVSEDVELGESLLYDVLEDINEILKVTKIKPKQIFLYVAPIWKQQVFRKAIELSQQGKPEMSKLMKELLSDSELKKKAKEVSAFAGKIIGEIKKLSDGDIIKYKTELDEKTYLEQSAKFLSKECGAEVKVYSADDKKLSDPADKARFAMPLRPAIYME